MSRELAIRRAKTIKTVLLDHGVPEVSIEVVEGRPVPGGRDRWNALDPVSVFSHHIASRPTPSKPTPGLALVKRGRVGGDSPLEGPLANGHAGVDLVYRIICLGWANHPGYGGPLTVRGPLGSFTIPRDNARPYAWGTEYEGGYTDEVWDRTYTNRRTGKKMTFREFMGRANAGLCEAIWLPGINSRDRYSRITPEMDLSTYHGEHKTWAPDRKVDRRNYTTASGRAEIRRFKEVDMGLSKEDREWLDKRFDRLDQRTSPKGAIRSRLATIDNQLDAIEKKVSDDATRQQVRRVRGDIAALQNEEEQT